MLSLACKALLIMAQLFSQKSNTLIRVGLAAALVSPVALAAVLMTAVRSPYQTGVGIVREQPVPFSHQHHVEELDIDCRYCHTAVERSSFAGMPATEICMGCHSQLWTNAKMLEPVHKSFATGQPLRWKRLHDLPDYVYFDHSIHIDKGVGCESCHGRIDKMPLAYKSTALLMSFCLDCHRRPQDFLRPKDQITTMGWRPELPQRAMGNKLMKEHKILPARLTDCSICHR